MWRLMTGGHQSKYRLRVMLLDSGIAGPGYLHCKKKNGLKQTKIRFATRKPRIYFNGTIFICFNFQNFFRHS